MKRLWSCLFLCFVSGAAADTKALLTQSEVASFLNEENPFFYGAVGARYVYQARAEAAGGVFDTRLGAKYDNKRYPASEGELADVYLEKATESGLEFLMGYRRAEGVQEYNNIKTGDEGEVRAGIKIPLVSVFSGMNEQRYRFQSASLESARSAIVSRENLRHLYFEVFSAYYRLLHRRMVVALETELLQKAKERLAFIRNKVDAGELAPIAQLEAQQQLLSRQQRQLEVQNGYDTALGTFLQYLGLTRTDFEARYALPELPAAETETRPLELLVQRAFDARPDLEAMRYEKERFDLDSDYNALGKYPKMNVALYGVHDFEYDNGFKISLDMDFPIEQRRYSGRQIEIRRSMRVVDEALAQRRIEIRTALENRLLSLKRLEANLQSAEAEIALARQLEAAEIKKFRLGASDLLKLNLRELATLQARQKRLDYRLRQLMLHLEIERETAAVPVGTPK